MFTGRTRPTEKQRVGERGFPGSEARSSQQHPEPLLGSSGEALANFLFNQSSCHLVGTSVVQMQHDMFSREHSFCLRVGFAFNFGRDNRLQQVIEAICHLATCGTNVFYTCLHLVFQQR